MTTPDTPDAGAENAQDELTPPPEGDAPEDTTEPDAPPDADSPAEEQEPTPEPRSLPWWKDRARTGEWLLAEAHHERDHLQARLAVVQQREVESLVTGQLHDPADLFQFGPPLAQLLDEDGNVDPALVDAALAAVLQAHPHIGKRYGISPAAPASAVTATGLPDPDATGTTFQDLLSGAVRRR